MQQDPKSGVWDTGEKDTGVVREEALKNMEEDTSNAKGIIEAALRKSMTFKHALPTRYTGTADARYVLYLTPNGGAVTREVVYGTLLCFALALVAACSATTGRTAGQLVDDVTIADTIRAKIVADKELGILKIDADVFNGDVTLLDVVPSKEAEEHLLSLVQGVKGVKSVTSKLTIQK